MSEALNPPHGERRGASPQAPTAAQPIADLSYRNYDGPLMDRRIRWWIIARETARLALKKKGFWFVALMAALPYVFYGLMLYIRSRNPLGRVPEPLEMTAPGQFYSGTMFLAFNSQQFLWLFIIAMMVGPGVIAADTQANALQVYLSKPITKADYLLGKWMGIFLVVAGVALAPSLLLYLYCLISYLGDGFLKEDPLLIVRVIAAGAIPGIIHASALCGVSAWSKTPRMAGAVYAGIYFVTFAVSQVMWGFSRRGDISQGILEQHLSITGVITGLAQNVFGVMFRQPNLGGGSGGLMVELAPPPLWAMLGLAVIIAVVGVSAARYRIRAVEVVRG